MSAASKSITKTIKAISTSFTVAGNVGISPFLTLFLLGIIERLDSNLLNMNSGMEYMLSSVVGLTLLGILTILEFVGKCVPVIDELIDSVEVFVVPALSVLGTLATMGLLEHAIKNTDAFQEEDNDDDVFGLVSNVTSLIGGDGTGTADDGSDGGGGRMLIVNTMLRGTKRFLQQQDQDDHTAGEQISNTIFMILQVIIIIIGIIIAVCIHLFKMIIRLFGEGCCTACITIVEVTFVSLCITVAIFIDEISILIAVIIVCITIYIIYKNCCQKKEEEPQVQQQQTNQQQQQQPGTTIATTTTTPTPAIATVTSEPTPPMAVATLLTGETTATGASGKDVNEKIVVETTTTTATATATPSTHPPPSAPTETEVTTLYPAKVE